MNAWPYVGSYGGWRCAWARCVIVIGGVVAHSRVHCDAGNKVEIKTFTIVSNRYTFHSWEYWSSRCPSTIDPAKARHIFSEGPRAAVHVCARVRVDLHRRTTSWSRRCLPRAVVVNVHRATN